MITHIIRAARPGRWLLRLSFLALMGVAIGTSGARADTPWDADYFPNHQLTAHTGEKLRFFDDVIDGKVVAINFIFTTCSDVCPMETARLRRVYQLLGDRVGDDVHFYSITIDPEHDTVKVLRDYADRYGIDGNHWKFLTGDKAEIDQIRERFGLEQFVPGEEENLSDHNISLVMGNQATGHWVRRSPFENPYILADQLGSWLHGFKRASAHTRDDFDQAPALRQISDGEMMFRDRCSSCHQISGGLAPARNAKPLGPDLYGVTQRRDEAWLRRWLAAPDRMLEEGDPIATAMYRQWRMVMPNFRLDEREITNLINYMAAETRRLQERTLARQDASAPQDVHDQAGHDHASHDHQH